VIDDTGESCGAENCQRSRPLRLGEDVTGVGSAAVKLMLSLTGFCSEAPVIPGAEHRLLWRVFSRTSLLDPVENRLRMKATSSSPLKDKVGVKGIGKTTVILEIDPATLHVH